MLFKKGQTKVMPKLNAKQVLQIKHPKRHDNSLAKYKSNPKYKSYLKYKSTHHFLSKYFFVNVRKVEPKEVIDGSILYKCVLFV